MKPSSEKIIIHETMCFACGRKISVKSMPGVRGFKVKPDTCPECGESLL